MSKVSGKLFHDHFGKGVFWEEKYAKNTDHFEWYHAYRMIKDVITQYTKDIPGAKVLNVGCGTSKLPEDMYNDGFRNIVSVDSSEDCIRIMKSKYNEKMPKTFIFMKMNLFHLNFGNGIFSHVVDKGTFDSIASGTRSTENLHRYLAEIDRVMQENGIYFCLSHRDLDERDHFFSKFKWKVFVHKIYRPEFNTELRYIKQQFISKEVIESIEAEKEITVNPEDLEKEAVEQELIAEILEEEKKMKEEKRAALEALKPREVICFYLYVCFKGDFESEKPKVEENNLMSAEGNDFIGNNTHNERSHQEGTEYAEEEGANENEEELHNASISESMD